MTESPPSTRQHDGHVPPVIQEQTWDLQDSALQLMNFMPRSADVIDLYALAVHNFHGNCPTKLTLVLFLIFNIEAQV